ncbi:uncharacterized protein VTP21DRAFT_1381 [Calcarisporiella thermophila]|uniref:uncharacterized protein n=1 Tax=Calcarisporiella thermophila TaxID=911321 RepID=UPI0037425DA2
MSPNPQIPSVIVKHIIALNGPLTTQQLAAHASKFPQIRSTTYLKRYLLKNLEAQRVLYKRVEWPSGQPEKSGRSEGKPVWKWRFRDQSQIEKYKTVTIEPNSA